MDGETNSGAGSNGVPTGDFPSTNGTGAEKDSNLSPSTGDRTESISAKATRGVRDGMTATHARLARVPFSDEELEKVLAADSFSDLPQELQEKVVCVPMMYNRLNHGEPPAQSVQKACALEYGPGAWGRETWQEEAAMILEGPHRDNVEEFLLDKAAWIPEFVDGEMTSEGRWYDEEEPYDREMEEEEFRK